MTPSQEETIERIALNLMREMKYQREQAELVLKAAKTGDWKQLAVDAGALAVCAALTAGAFYTLQVLDANVAAVVMRYVKGEIEWNKIAVAWYAQKANVEDVAKDFQLPRFLLKAHAMQMHWQAIPDNDCCGPV